MIHRRKSDLLLASKIPGDPNKALTMLLEMYANIKKHQDEGYLIRAYKERGYVLELKDIKI